ncbi:unnamed protein product [Darwinula stevensoni]|uniref:Uncharacterized protein n=1 Tax=Darwinula stevensoni TaxID=69355 RepID=A0A7R9ACJ8_9CRUS|nr:unnamed protein product [Darwinula stevensoni]CAG0899898.1 unnamed protein product [Darwinula stevensoni]
MTSKSTAEEVGNASKDRRLQIGTHRGLLNGMTSTPIKGEAEDGSMDRGCVVRQLFGHQPRSGSKEREERENALEISTVSSISEHGEESAGSHTRDFSLQAKEIIQQCMTNLMSLLHNDKTSSSIRTADEVETPGSQPDQRDTSINANGVFHSHTYVPTTFERTLSNTDLPVGVAGSHFLSDVSLPRNGDVTGYLGPSGDLTAWSTLQTTANHTCGRNRYSDWVSHVFESQLLCQKLRLEAHFQQKLLSLSEEKSREVAHLHEKYQRRMQEYEGVIRDLEQQIQRGAKDFIRLNDVKNKQIKELTKLLEERQRTVTVNQLPLKDGEQEFAWEMERCDIEKRHVEQLKTLIQESNGKLREMQDQYQNQAIAMGAELELLRETKKRLEERLQEVENRPRLKDRSEGGSQRCLNNSESKGTQTSPVVFLEKDHRPTRVEDQVAMFKGRENSSDDMVLSGSLNSSERADSMSTSRRRSGNESGDLAAITSRLRKQVL